MYHEPEPFNQTETPQRSRMCLSMCNAWEHYACVLVLKPRFVLRVSVLGILYKPAGLLAILYCCRTDFRAVCMEVTMAYSQRKVSTFKWFLAAECRIRCSMNIELIPAPVCTKSSHAADYKNSIAKACSHGCQHWRNHYCTHISITIYVRGHARHTCNEIGKQRTNARRHLVEDSRGHVESCTSVEDQNFPDV